MALIGDTGNGATLTFNTTSTSFAVTKLRVGSITIDMLEASKLSTTDFKEYIPSDLKDTPEISAEIIWQTKDEIPPVGGSPQTGTVTFPLRTGESTAANLAGTGVFTDVGFPELANGQVQMAEFKFRYDGDTGPAYSKSVAT